MGVAGQGVVFEGVAERIVGIVQHIVRRAAVTDVPADRELGGPHRPLARLDPQHRARQQRPVDARLMLFQRQEVEGRAHRMADGDPRPGRPRLEGVEQAAEIVEEFLHRPSVAAHPVGQEPRRQALAAPVMGQDAEAPRQEVGEQLVVFLERLGAARREDDGAARRGRGGPVGGPEAQAAGAAIPFALAARWRHGAGNAHQGCIGGIGLGAAHAVGFLNLRVMRSLSPMAS